MLRVILLILSVQVCFAAEKLEFNWEDDSQKETNQKNVSPAPKKNVPVPPVSSPKFKNRRNQQQNPMNSFGRIHDLMNQMQQQMMQSFDDPFFNDPFANDPFFNRPFGNQRRLPHQPNLTQPNQQNQPNQPNQKRRNNPFPFPNQGNLFHGFGGQGFGATDLNVVEKKNFIIVEIPANSANTKLDVKLHGNQLSVQITEQSSQEQKQGNQSFSSFSSYSSRSVSTPLPAEVSKDYTQTYTNNKFILTFKKI
jgi:HSP20 family molecular chaperone IbpA